MQQQEPNEMIRKTILLITGVLLLSGSIALFSVHQKSGLFFIPTGLIFITIACNIHVRNKKVYRKKLALYRVRMLMKGKDDDHIEKRLSLIRFFYGITN